MTDTHTHLYTEDFPGDEAAEAVRRAIAAGVDRIILPNVDRESVAALLALHAAFPHNTYIAPGLHPSDVEIDWHEELCDIMQRFAGLRIVGIGETGIDLHYTSENIEEQRDAFRAQISLARDHDVPLIIHSRDAFDETLAILKECGQGVRGVFHSFTGTPEEAQRIMQSGDYMFGINGVVTFKNAPALRDALKVIGIERIMLETDAPWLAPVPHRGSRNESSYLGAVCGQIAQTLEMDTHEVEAITDSNAVRFFKL